MTKYRKQVITGGLESFLKDYTVRYFKERGTNLIALETMPDHIYVQFEAPPQINLADFVNAYKSASSRQVRKAFERELEAAYEGTYFWSLSYFIGSMGDTIEETCERYLEDQNIYK